MPHPFEKNYLDSKRELLLASKPKPEKFSQLYCEIVDEFIKNIVAESVKTTFVKKPFAIIATGGYGRQELSPYSDIDLTVVHDNISNIKELTNKFFYPIWDQGIKFDYSVRTLSDTKSQILKDPKVALGLMDARLLYSTSDFGEYAIKKIRGYLNKSFKTILPEIVEIFRQRHNHFGQIGEILEPNLKDSKGGLRDIALIKTTSSFEISNSISFSFGNLSEQHTFLSTIRFLLHAYAKRALDTLYLQEQQYIAKSLGFESSDQLVINLSNVGHTVSLIFDMYIKELLKATKKSSFLKKPPKLYEVGSDFEITGDTLKLKEGANLADETIAIRMAIEAIKHNVDLSYESLKKLAENVQISFPIQPAVKQLFLELLKQGHKSLQFIQILDFFGIFEKYLPIWPQLRFLPQHNPIHRFTVDKHLLETVANATEFLEYVTREDLLVFGCLFHDIGKAKKGDHTQNGIEIITELGPQLGINKEDLEILKRLIEHHLLLSDTATRRDLDDLNTIKSVAQKVQDVEFLKLLRYMTEADTKATSEHLWSSWREKLIDELVNKVELYLAEGQLYKEPVIDLSDPEVAFAIKKGELSLIQQGEELIVIAPDHPGLLAELAGSFAVNMISIKSVRAACYEKKIAVDKFKLSFPENHDINWEKIKSDIQMAILDPTFLNSPISKLLDSYQRLKHKRKYHAEGPRVIHLADASYDSTVVEVRSPDAPALLYFITRTITEQGYNVKSALVDTLGNEAIDVFYIQDASQNQLHSDQIMKLSENILENLSWL